jgi:lactam utilization protein B
LGFMAQDRRRPVSRQSMSAALDLLSECKAAGVELYLDNGRLRYRAQPGAYTEAFRQRVAMHRDAVVAALEGRSITLDFNSRGPRPRDPGCRQTQ